MPSSAVKWSGNRTGTEGGGRGTATPAAIGGGKGVAAPPAAPAATGGGRGVAATRGEEGQQSMGKEEGQHSGEVKPIYKSLCTLFYTLIQAVKITFDSMRFDQQKKSLYSSSFRVHSLSWHRNSVVRRMAFFFSIRVCHSASTGGNQMKCIQNGLLAECSFLLALRNLRMKDKLASLS